MDIYFIIFIFAASALLFDFFDFLSILSKELKYPTVFKKKNVESSFQINFNSSSKFDPCS